MEKTWRGARRGASLGSSVGLVTCTARHGPSLLWHGTPYFAQRLRQWICGLPCERSERLCSCLLRLARLGRPMRRKRRHPHLPRRRPARRPRHPCCTTLGDGDLRPRRSGPIWRPGRKSRRRCSGCPRWRPSARASAARIGAPSSGTSLRRATGRPLGRGRGTTSAD